MQIGTVALSAEQRLSGTLDYHGRQLRLQLRPLATSACSSRDADYPINWTRPRAAAPSRQPALSRP